MSQRGVDETAKDGLTHMGRPAMVVVAPMGTSGKVLEVPPGRWCLGRSGELQVDAPGVSRYHAWVEYDGGALWITDGGSTNGTFVGGRRIPSRTQLRHGDAVGIGEVMLSVHMSADEDCAAPASNSQCVETRETPGDPARSESTRLLCAAVHQDRAFREQVMDEIVDQPYRAVCPSYGVDLVAVVLHALAAQRQRLVRDVALVFLLCIAILGAAILSGGSDAASTIWTLWLVVCFLAWLVVGIDSWWRRYVVLAMGLARNAPRLRDPGKPGGARVRRRIDAIARIQASNVLTFSGFSPFVGSGTEFDDWAFAIDIEKGARDLSAGARKVPKSFTVGDLYAALKANVVTVGLPGLRAEERLFVNGVDVWQFPSLLPNRLAAPVGSAQPELLEAIREVSHGSARTYLCFEVTGWHGQLVVTMFMRALRLKGSLYLEWTSTALLPLRDEYYEVDRLPRRLGDALVSSFVTAIASALPSLLASPFFMWRHLGRRLKARRRRRRQREQISADLNVDYGARSSVREDAMGETFNRYFLRLDVAMYTKVVQLRLLKRIFDFLEQHDLDTSDFVQQQVNINNSQTISVSGYVGAGAAVGARARAGDVQQGKASSASGASK